MVGLTLVLFGFGGFAVFVNSVGQSCFFTAFVVVCLVVAFRLVLFSLFDSVCIVCCILLDCMICLAWIVV